jgi:hypothetical protein
VKPDGWSQVSQLYHAALAKDASERARFLAEACKGDDTLRREVESLLAQEGTAEGFLAAPAFEIAGKVMAEDSGGSLTGRQLGTYQILSRLGAGGMGEVYRARDPKLGRDVAIKILPRACVSDPERLARFEREARVLAALNHPHIGAIYGFQESDTVQALVLELVEGPTLADRIAQGPIPLDEALPISRQICEALETAHEQGIIHRDLKPANIKVRADGTVKVLDFGLAKAFGGDGPDPDVSHAPTPTLARTREGLILGTPAYMSPEQARGQVVDKRSDIWAFGCVLYEMLTGKRAFEGENVSDTLATVLKSDPDWTMIPKEVPAQLPTLLKKCLEKDRRTRIPDISVARFLLTETIVVAQPSAPVVAPLLRRTLRKRTLADRGLGLLAGMVLTTAGVWIVARLMPARPPQPVQFAIAPPPARPLSIQGANRDIAISPDGTHIVYRTGATTLSGPTPLAVRAIDRLDPETLAVTNAQVPFLSPDGRWVGFFDFSELKKVPITGGSPITLCRIQAPPAGASWGPDDTIIFATADSSSGLVGVPAGGGEPKVLTKPDQASGEQDHVFPSILPGGRAVLFTITAPGQIENAQVAVFDLKTGARKILIHGGSHAEYVETGHLVYAVAGTLRAVRFDLKRLEVMGDPVPVVERVMTKQTGAANFAVSRGGTLSYVPAGAGSGAITPRSLVWVNRQGREDLIKAPPRAYVQPRLSPDGTRVALEIADQDYDIWIWDLSRQTLTRLTSDPSQDLSPIWTPDGKRILFDSIRAGPRNVFWQAADGTGTVVRLTTRARETFQSVDSISPDGTQAILVEYHDKTALDVVLLDLGSLATEPGAGQRRTETLVQTPFTEQNGETSPDGRWLAYQSNESGRMEIYVRPFPRVNSGRWQVSTGGGSRPAWGRSGRELFYLDGNNAMTAVAVQPSGPTFIAGNPTKLFDWRYGPNVGGRTYDVSADSQRFLMIKDNAASPIPPSIIVVQHWVEELKRLVPTK